MKKFLYFDINKFRIISKNLLFLFHSCKNIENIMGELIYDINKRWKFLEIKLYFFN